MNASGVAWLVVARTRFQSVFHKKVLWSMFTPGQYILLHQSGTVEVHMHSAFNFGTKSAVESTIILVFIFFSPNYIYSSLQTNMVSPFWFCPFAEYVFFPL